MRDVLVAFHTQWGPSTLHFSGYMRDKGKEERDPSRDSDVPRLCTEHGTRPSGRSPGIYATWGVKIVPRWTIGRKVSDRLRETVRVMRE